MKKFFLPTIFYKSNNILEESTLAYIRACMFLFKNSFKKLIRIFLGFVFSSSVAITVFTWSLHGNLKFAYELLLTLSSLFSITLIFLAISWYRKLPNILALAKTYIRLEILPLGDSHTVLFCAWVPTTTIKLTKISHNVIKQSLSSLKSNIKSLDEEVTFLTTMEEIVSTEKAASARNLHVKLIHNSVQAKEILSSLLKNGLQVKKQHENYLSYYLSILEENIPKDENILENTLKELQNDLDYMKQSKKHLEKYSWGVRDYLSSLRKESLSLNKDTESVLNSLSQSNHQNNTRESLIKNAMRETRECIKEELLPIVEKIENDHQSDIETIEEQYKLRTKECKEKFTASVRTLEQEIAFHKKNIKRYTYKKNALIDNRKKQIDRVRKAEKNIQKAQEQINAIHSEISTFAETPPLHRENLYAYQTEVRFLESNLIDYEQKIEDYNIDIEDLALQIKEEENIILDKKDFCNELEENYKDKLGQLEGEEYRKVTKLQKILRRKIRNERAPLLNIENLENNLDNTWENQLKTTNFNHETLFKEYLKTTSKILEYRRKAADTLFTKAKKSFTNQTTKLDQSKKQIESFLWKKDFWNGVKIVYIPIWLLTYQTSSDNQKKITYISTNPKIISPRTQHSQQLHSFSLDKIPEFKDYFQSIIQSTPQNLFSYLEQKNIINSKNLTFFFPITLKNLQKTKKVSLIATIIAKINLKRQKKN